MLWIFGPRVPLLATGFSFWLVPALVSCDCYNKSPWTLWLKATQAYYLTVLELKVQTGAHWAGIKVLAGLRCFVEPLGRIPSLPFCASQGFLADGPLPPSKPAGTSLTSAPTPSLTLLPPLICAGTLWLLNLPGQPRIVPPPWSAQVVTPECAGLGGWSSRHLFSTVLEAGNPGQVTACPRMAGRENVSFLLASQNRCQS